MKLGGQGYVFWCGREGYETLLNTNMALEQDNMARTLRWFKTIMPVLKHHGIGRAVWNYKEMDYGLIDLHIQPIFAEIKKELFD